MLKKNITYDTFDGETVTEEFYFNLTRTEIVEMQFGVEGGLQEALMAIIKEKDYKQLLSQMKEIILLSYGQKSEDGKRFIKSKQLREEFEQSAAWDTLFMEVATNDNACAEFVMGIVPPGIITQAEADEAMETFKKQIETEAGERTVKDIQLPPPPSISS